MSNFRNTIFYSIEVAIKSYRRLAQEQIQRKVPDLTVNQCLLLSLIADSESLSQAEMAEILFKDVAAITRMVELMVRKQYLERKPNPEDRRRQKIVLTAKGRSTVQQITPVIIANRQTATAGLTAAERKELQRLLRKITQNCTNPQL